MVEKDGSNPDVRLTCIATTMVATFELLHRAAAAKRNLIVVHEPTFYSNLDDPHEVADDPMFRMRRDFIADNRSRSSAFMTTGTATGPMALSTEWPLALAGKNIRTPITPTCFFAGNEPEFSRC
jgi:hypothetical protein